MGIGMNSIESPAINLRTESSSKGDFTLCEMLWAYIKVCKDTNRSLVVLPKEHYSPLGRLSLLPKSFCVAQLKLQNLHVLLFLTCYKRDNYRGAKRINVIEVLKKRACKIDEA